MLVRAQTAAVACIVNLTGAAVGLLHLANNRGNGRRGLKSRVNREHQSPGSERYQIVSVHVFTVSKHNLAMVVKHYAAIMKKCTGKESVTSSFDFVDTTPTLGINHYIGKHNAKKSTSPESNSNIKAA